ncbi:hypothetical protein DRQ53_11825 [bacterium]|nr:MAG: hypothetical protein DRQ53_11825 [bacterium]
MKRTLRAALLLAAGTLCVGDLYAEEFSTIASGNWTDGTTWSGGVAPATDVDGDDIAITHDVTVVNNDIKLLGGASFSATGASFTMANGNFTVEDGLAEFEGCNVLVVHGFSIQITTADGSLFMTDCEVDVGQNFQNSEGIRYLENVCMVVDENFQNAKGTDTLINVCAIIGNDSSGNFQNDSDSSMHIEDSEFHLPNGNFQNQSNAVLSGNITALWLENGNLQNDGAWSAQVANYCVSQSVTVNSTYLPASQDCAGIADFFNPCNCAPDPEVTTLCIADQNDCPCGNDFPGSGCSNGTGQGALLTASGSTSVAADDLLLHATDMPANIPMLFFAGEAPSFSRTAFGNGLLCADPTSTKLLRIRPVLQTDANGAGNVGPGLVALLLQQNGAVVGEVQPGETWYFQAFYRDNNSCGNGFNLTSAITVSFTQ